jgi:hypothetical protein
MAERRRRHLRRDLLIFLGSVALHVGLFFVAASNFNFYTLPEERETAVEVQIVPPPFEPPPPIPRIPKPTTARAAESSAPQPTPQQAKPAPQPARPASTPAPPQPVQTPTAPARAAHAPTPAPAPKLSPAPAPLSPAAPVQAPGPPKSVPRSAVAVPAPRSVSAPHIVLHKSRDQGAPLGPTLNLPGATFAPPPQATAGGGSGSPGGAGGGSGGLTGGGLPGGALPGFGRGLRGGLLGCANAAALHLSAAEQARCDEAFGDGARESPRMDPIDASRRTQFDHEAAQEEQARKYRDSTPAGSNASPTPGQPKILQSPGK